MWTIKHTLRLERSWHCFMTLLQLGRPLNAAEVRKHFVVSEHKHTRFHTDVTCLRRVDILCCVALKCTYVPNRNVHQGTVRLVGFSEWGDEESVIRLELWRLRRSFLGSPLEGSSVVTSLILILIVFPVCSVAIYPLAL